MSLIGVRIQQDILGTSKDILGTNNNILRTNKDALGASKNKIEYSNNILGTNKDKLGTNKTTMQHDILDTEGEDDKGAAPDPKALTLVFLPVLSSINGCMPL